jgi:hypothetical protein
VAANNLGTRQALGVLSSANKIVAGAWVVTFRPNDMPPIEYEIWHGLAIGPGGYFFVYLDDTPYGVGDNGLFNEYAPTKPQKVRPGQTVSVHWSTNAAMPAGSKYATPFVVFYLQRPEGIV